MTALGHDRTGLEHSRTLLHRVLIVIGLGVALALIPFLSGLLGALMLFVVVRTPHRQLRRIMPPRVAAFTICIGIFVLLVVPGMWLVSTIVSELGDVVRSWQGTIALDRIVQTPLGRFDIAKSIAALGSSLLAWLSSRAVVLFGNVTLTMLNLIVALFGLYYLLVEGHTLWRRAKSLGMIPPRMVDHLGERFASVTEALLLGTGFTAVLQGTIVGAGFAIVGFSSPLLWGFVTACASVLPMFGSALVWLPAVGVLLLEHRTGAAILMGALGAGVASNIDNVARLFVYRRVSGIHPMLTLVGAFAGVHVFGIIGVFLGPLILSYFAELLLLYESAVRERHEHIPTATDFKGSESLEKGV
jgi:predicted PurR-regulated permease PerM